MRFAYFGTSTFAVPALERLAESVVLVVTQPDRPSGRGHRLQPTPVKVRALEFGLPVETPEKARDPEFVERIRSLELDALIVAAYGQILSVKLLESARNGGINLHGSILPKYRGAAPIQRAILDGEKETGVTLMQMDKGMDTGDMIDIVRTPIHPDETYGELQDRLAQLAANQVADWAPRLARGDYPRTVQDSSLATHAAKVEKSEAELSVLRAARGEYDRFRAFTPAPGAFLTLPEGSLRIHEARLGPDGISPGQVEQRPEGWALGFLDGSLILKTVQPAGKRAMAAEDFVNGARIRSGDQLVNPSESE